MTDAIFISIVVITQVSFVAIAAINRIQEKIIKRQRKRIEQLMKYNDSLIEYCLNDTIRHSIEVEDYETAKKCKALIDGIRNETNGD